jgi:hypothetical protein
MLSNVEERTSLLNYLVFPRVLRVKGFSLIALTTLNSVV